VDDKFKIIYW